MKMTLCMIISLLTMFSIMQPFVQTSACPIKGEATGSACSVKDIQNLENQRMQEKADFNLGGLKEGKNLRPVKINPEIKNPEETSCIFCLQEGVFGKLKP